MRTKRSMGRKTSEEKPGKDLSRMEDDEDEEHDSDRTAIQGIRNLTSPEEERAASASLIVISGSHAGRQFKLNDSSVCIGRAKECDICIDEEGISRKHVQIDRDTKGNITITDLNSTNGTYFNGSRISRRTLQDGDKIQIGPTTILKFSYQDSIEEAFHHNQYVQATRDGLTGVYNKKFFVDRFSKEVSYAQRHNSILTLVLFDIDHFKQVNDVYGHTAGDMVLRQLADIVDKSLRNEDVLARFGGEEFAIIFREVGERQAHVLAERVRRLVEIHDFIWEGKPILITISLGVSTFTHDNFRDASEMIRAADDYLYDAKREGRNRVVSIVR
jgi:two-component system, cell cycle response regulator